MVKIRLATTDDIDVLARIARDAYAPYVPLIGREPPPMLQDFEADVALKQCWVIGTPASAYVVARPGGATWLLENVAVAPASNGRGHGRALISHVEHLAAEAGATSVDLYTNAKMTRNLILYPSLGYVEVDRRAGLGLERVFFRKALA